METAVQNLVELNVLIHIDHADQLKLLCSLQRSKQAKLPHNLLCYQ